MRAMNLIGDMISRIIPLAACFAYTIINWEENNSGVVNLRYSHVFGYSSNLLNVSIQFDYLW